MAMALEMVRGGLSPGSARAINGQVASAVAAAGTTQATATLLGAGHNVVTTVADASGVILPNVEIGDEIFVYNGTATNTLSVYPPTSGTINQLAANLPGYLPAYRGAMFKKVTSIIWTAFMSA